MATSDIDDLLATLRGSEKVQRDAARECLEQIEASWVSTARQEAIANSEAFTAGADQKARQIAAVEELVSESKETERQHGYKEYFNG